MCFVRNFFIKRPLLQAFINPVPAVLLIDEIDKADEEVESFLLQALGEKEITVNDLGTFTLKKRSGGCFNFQFPENAFRRNQRSVPFPLY